MRSHGSTRVTVSWPEMYEATYGHFWARPLPVISWGGCIQEANAMLAELNAHNPSNGPPPTELGQAAVEALRNLAADFPREALEQLSARAFNPRFLAVFIAQPSGQRLLQRLTNYAKRYWGEKRRVAVPDDVAEAAAFMELIRNQQMLQWVHFGRRIYVLGRHTASLLARTDLPNMPVGELPFPFQSFYLRLPGWMYEMRNGSTRIPVDGLMVTTDHTAHDPTKPRELQIQVCPNRVFGIGESSPRSIWTGVSTVSIRDVASELQAQLIEPGTSLTPLDGEHDPLPHLVLGFLLYLASEHPLLEPVPPPGPIKRNRTASPSHAARLKATDTTRLGFVRVGGEDPPVDTPGQAGKPLTHLVWVRGHWRQQAHGPAHTLRRPTWIEPHVRGPDLADQLTARAGYVQDAQQTKTDPHG